jgi:hypothetical protein
VPYVYVGKQADLGRACGVSRNIVAACILKVPESGLQAKVNEMKDKVEQLLLWLINFSNFILKMPALNATGLKTEGDLTKDEFVPSGFLDTNGMCVLPSFYQPETESLRWATHNNIRRTMFHHVWRSVKYVEYLRL